MKDPDGNSILTDKEFHQIAYLVERYGWDELQERFKNSQINF